jgi:hypothetical protein
MISTVLDSGGHVLPMWIVIFGVKCIFDDFSVETR